MDSDKSLTTLAEVNKILDDNFLPLFVILEQERILYNFSLRFPDFPWSLKVT
jgi:hypothetical protein